MSSLPRIRERLPSLYRPEPADGRSLLARWLRDAAGLADTIDRDASDVMQSHWFEFADRALYSPYVRRQRVIAELGPLTRDEELDLAFPYVDDLARLGSLLGILPWREPASDPERVEHYRRRIKRIVELYTQGLGTVGAVRRMTEAQLSPDSTVAGGLGDRPFTVEEFAPLVGTLQQASGRGPPLDLVGPLMRWRVPNEGLSAAAATAYIQGIAPDPGATGPTARPALELFSSGGRRVRLAIAYEGTVPAGQTLRLQPTHMSWLATNTGLLRAVSAPSNDAPADQFSTTDPTAAGPWSAVATGGAPTAAVTAMLRADDHTLWVAVGEGAGTPASLLRFDGTAWTQVVTGLPTVHALAQSGDAILLATAGGLARLALYPANGAALGTVPAPAALTSHEVFALLRDMDGTWWAGTEDGLARIGAADALQPFVLGADAATRVPTYALHQDSGGVLFAAGERGVFRLQRSASGGRWHWYQGREQSEQLRDWQRFDPTAASADARNFPHPNDAFLPPVRCIRRTADTSLWLGTDHGIARYVARAVDGTTYTTLLEAYPDLAPGRVYSIVEDERGLVWFATEQGLFRYDGRDWWQMRAGTFVRIAPADDAVDVRPRARHWRFDRDTNAWQVFDDRRQSAGTWLPFAGDARATAEPPVRAIAFTDGVVADLGTWDGEQFTRDDGLAVAELRMRYKPDERRIVDGGIPALPRVPAGESVWRYLALEPDDPAAIPEPRSTPAWTMEGRLLPPPDSRAAVMEGRFGEEGPSAFSAYDDAVFAYDPAARVWLSWQGRRTLTVLVRLGLLSSDEHIEPAMLDRVWQGIEQVRPLGARAMLAVGETIVRGR